MSGGEAPERLDILTVEEVCREYRFGRSWLYAASKDGRVPSIRYPGKKGVLRWVRQDLDAWIDQCRRGWKPGDTSTATMERVRDGE